MNDPFVKLSPAKLRKIHNKMPVIKFSEKLFKEHLLTTSDSKFYCQWESILLFSQIHTYDKEMLRRIRSDLGLQ